MQRNSNQGIVTDDGAHTTAPTSDTFTVYLQAWRELEGEEGSEEEEEEDDQDDEETPRRSTPIERL